MSEANTATQNVVQRIAHPAQFNDIVARLFDAAHLGEPLTVDPIAQGYDDCNVKVKTANGTFVLKLFATSRSYESRARLVRVLDVVQHAHLGHPKLFPAENGTIWHRDAATDNSGVIMEFVEGATYQQLGTTPNDDELRSIIAQVARMHDLTFDPGIRQDSWAVQNMARKVELCRDFLGSHDRSLIDAALYTYSSLRLESMPITFCHGDIIASNVIRTTTKEPVIIDYSVCNRYPRIQDLAVIAAQLTADPSLPLSTRCTKIADLYDVHHTLSVTERSALPRLTFAVLATLFLGGVYDTHVSRVNAEESAQWTKFARAELAAAQTALAL